MPCFRPASAQASSTPATTASAATVSRRNRPLERHGRCRAAARDGSAAACARERERARSPWRGVGPAREPAVELAPLYRAPRSGRSPARAGLEPCRTRRCSVAPNARRRRCWFLATRAARGGGAVHPAAPTTRATTQARRARRGHRARGTPTRGVAALRETREETGIAPSPCSRCFLDSSRPSAALRHPVVGAGGARPCRGARDPREVAAVSRCRWPSARSRQPGAQPHIWQGWPRDISRIRHDGRRIWGATAAMLSTCSADWRDAHDHLTTPHHRVQELAALGADAGVLLAGLPPRAGRPRQG